jgi:hypothetical protein
VSFTGPSEEPPSLLDVFSPNVHADAINKIAQALSTDRASLDRPTALMVLLSPARPAGL